MRDDPYRRALRVGRKDGSQPRHFIGGARGIFRARVFVVSRPVNIVENDCAGTADRQFDGVVAAFGKLGSPRSSVARVCCSCPLRRDVGKKWALRRVCLFAALGIVVAVYRNVLRARERAPKLPCEERDRLIDERFILRFVGRPKCTLILRTKVPGQKVTRYDHDGRIGVVGLHRIERRLQQRVIRVGTVRRKRRCAGRLENRTPAFGRRGVQTCYQADVGERIEMNIARYDPVLHLRSAGNSRFEERAAYKHNG